MRNKFITAVLTATLLALGWVTFASSASATPPLTQTVGQCGDTSTQTTRPDSGHHGDWATLILTRKTHVCRTAEDTYTATISDDGTLTTLASLSPRDGVSLTAGTTGEVHGTYDWTFTAKNLNLDALVSPSADTTTSTWLQELVKASGGEWCNGEGHEYIWTYTTCSEKWVDASNNNDGQDGSAGDITGKKCPVETPTPTPSSSTPVSHPSTPTSIHNAPVITHAKTTHHAVVVQANSETPDAQPVLASTGPRNIGGFLAAALLALVLGCGLLFAGRKVGHRH